MSKFNTQSAPLMEALIQYREQRKKSFHVPGHKNGHLYAQTDIAGLLANVMSIDATEISGLDDLHHPEGVIRQAQELAADCFGAEESFFLVGGSTSGNLALILSVCTEPGDILLVQRNVHKSVLHGLMLAAADAVFLEPYVDETSGLSTLPSAETVAAAIAAYPQAKGLLVTSPNYYGMGTDLVPLAELCHHAGIPLLVDEAHGAHFGQHPDLPPSALSCGADGVVQSTHKMLSAMTMGAMLHIQGKLLHREVVRQRLAMIQSSSPSYPIMASLDLARRHLHMNGPSAFTEGLAAVQAFKEGISRISRFQLLQPDAGRINEGYIIQDPFKIVIYDRYGRLSGYELQRQLEQQGCVPEMSDERYVILLFTLATTQADAIHLVQALVHIHKQEMNPLIPSSFPEVHSFGKEISTWNNAPVLAVSKPVSFRLKPASAEIIKTIPIEACAGYMAAEMVIPYPPGIPLLYPGEKIGEEVALRLQLLRDQGAKCQGAADEKLNTIRVYLM
ncbi:aminotransferase class I/II-fold pyridoxal phosphate-dependent enzyme [Paenibacillus sp. P96]|uniref:Aminotransferase class I/II-fold pyridoxal phosphate-dependent enzyme n=1 Tax=Paenibacillus zeirhizosphaerae TaxID=2987519 RepID=A0ABT9FWP5_9BACL|nr:aminotransferase class I/II-fold pyridoxal phosphate-dependent enzyme [Paenibacillus sp. P96]MDP4099156.1 aminotransferase class I/II-fold pyridoxal phosphate-dependent enzyme [Paenibacillus sp. P96]